LKIRFLPPARRELKDVVRYYNAQIGEEGGATRVLKLHQIEPEFLERMFNVDDV